MTLSILGIDEAGRGSVIGPLVMYGVIVTPQVTPFLLKLGVRDSKKVRPHIRDELAATILKCCAYEYKIATAQDVDDAVWHTSLNELEQHMAQRIINRCNAFYEDQIGHVILDGQSLFDPLRKKLGRQIIAEDKADQNHLAVAAASICAKAHRDQLLRWIAGGPLPGNGYPNPNTCTWLRENRTKIARKYIRHTWKWGALDELGLRHPPRGLFSVNSRSQSPGGANPLPGSENVSEDTTVKENGVRIETRV